MQITELEALLFILCCFFGWRLYIKHEALLRIAAELERRGALIARICAGVSTVERTAKGNIREVPTNPDWE